MAPSKLQDFIRAVQTAIEQASAQGEPAVIITSPGIRPFVRSIIERFRNQTFVLSQNEIHKSAQLKNRRASGDAGGGMIQSKACLPRSQGFEDHEIEVGEGDQSGQ